MSERVPPSNEIVQRLQRAAQLPEAEIDRQADRRLRSGTTADVRIAAAALVQSALRATGSSGVEAARAAAGAVGAGYLTAWALLGDLPAAPRTKPIGARELLLGLGRMDHAAVARAAGARGSDLKETFLRQGRARQSDRSQDERLFGAGFGLAVAEAELTAGSRP